LSCNSVSLRRHHINHLIHSHINREGETLHVLANELVPGDLVKFITGDRIPADIRVVDAVDLEVDESSLTGETEARKKTSDTCEFGYGSREGEPAALADRTCIAYMGTLVRNGESRVIASVKLDADVFFPFGCSKSKVEDLELLLLLVSKQNLVLFSR
jgi:Ca2+-transporting ATPase